MTTRSLPTAAKISGAGSPAAPSLLNSRGSTTSSFTLNGNRNYSQGLKPYKSNSASTSLGSTTATSSSNSRRPSQGSSQSGLSTSSRKPNLDRQKKGKAGHVATHLSLPLLAPHIDFNPEDALHNHGVVVARTAYFRRAPWIVPNDWFQVQLREIRNVLARNGRLMHIEYAHDWSNIFWSRWKFENPHYGHKPRHDAHMEQVLHAYHDHHRLKDPNHHPEPWHHAAHDLSNRNASRMEKFLREHCVVVILPDGQGGKHRVIWPDALIKAIAWRMHGAVLPKGFFLHVHGGGKGRGAKAIRVGPAAELRNEE